ncbi:MAG TPA: hypothetical protein DHW71_15045 [Gammaproteobacteria bacterium]|nr:hypothetical protein [Gammaproteobacteria bacterium]MEC8009286.1 hypothetical protein [Pseudomonadota bacterium]HBF06761.1 hypothetical protein [Gammaproteobacteria bacterium]HCK94310.1 hypothetical protein [Gammaproteobacteria bacterium]|tara:strand:+ start:2997 stop:3707 length:711 start_codon:yes stop_codon:yes gene_type:complete
MGFAVAQTQASPRLTTPSFEQNQFSGVERAPHTFIPRAITKSQSLTDLNRAQRLQAVNSSAVVPYTPSNLLNDTMGIHSSFTPGSGPDHNIQFERMQHTDETPTSRAPQDASMKAKNPKNLLKKIAVGITLGLAGLTFGAITVGVAGAALGIGLGLIGSVVATIVGGAAALVGSAIATGVALTVPAALLFTAHVAITTHNKAHPEAPMHYPSFLNELKDFITHKKDETPETSSINA